MQQALQDANQSLQLAVQKLTNGEILEDQDKAETSSSETTPVDPDDLAAAFFASQAKKKQQETKLPINEWAKAITGVGHDEMVVRVSEECPERRRRSTSQPENIDSTLDTKNNNHDNHLRNQLIDTLFFEFQHSMQEDNTSS